MSKDYFYFYYRWCKFFFHGAFSLLFNNVLLKAETFKSLCLEHEHTLAYFSSRKIGEIFKLFVYSIICTNFIHVIKSIYNSPIIFELGKFDLTCRALQYKLSPSYKKHKVVRFAYFLVINPSFFVLS
jgi:hypothetical protein